MLQHADDDALTPAQRRQEIARLLAAGVRRLHARAALPPATQLPAPKNLPESGGTGLEVRAETRLSVQPG